MSEIIKDWEIHKTTTCIPSNNVLTPSVIEISQKTHEAVRKIIADFEEANVLDNGIYWDCPLVCLIDILEKFENNYSSVEKTTKAM